MHITTLNYLSAFVGQIETRSKLLLAVKKDILLNDTLSYRVHYIITDTNICFHSTLIQVDQALSVVELDDSYIVVIDCSACDKKPTLKVRAVELRDTNDTIWSITKHVTKSVNPYALQESVQTTIELDRGDVNNSDDPQYIKPSYAVIAANIFDFLAKIQGERVGVDDVIGIMGEKDEIVSKESTAATVKTAAPVTGSVFYRPQYPDVIFVPFWFDQQHWERWNRPDGIISGIVDDPIIHLWNETYNKLMLEMEIIENVLSKRTINDEPPPTTRGSEFRVPRLPRCVGYLSTDADLEALSEYITNIAFHVAKHLTQRDIPTITSHLVDIGEQYKCSELSGYAAAQKSILQTLATFKNLYGEIDTCATVAVVLRITPYDNMAVLKWYYDRNVTTLDSRTSPQECPSSYDTTLFDEFTRLVQQHVDVDVRDDVIEALGKALDEILANTPFHIRIESDFSIIIDHPIFAPGLICYCDPLQAISVSVLDLVRDIKAATAGYTSLFGVAPQ
jgi:hypothetical protein